MWKQPEFFNYINKIVFLVRIDFNKTFKYFAIFKRKSLLSHILSKNSPHKPTGKQSF